jgi:hypothetical protein
MNLKTILMGSGLTMVLACLLLVSGCAGLGPQTKPRVFLSTPVFPGPVR